MSPVFHRFAPALAEDSVFHAMSLYFTQSLRRGLPMLVGLASAIAAIIAVFWMFRLRIATTDSACRPGIYRMVNRPISRGDLVLACLPLALARFAQARGYLARGRGCGDGIEPVGKRIGALPGDTVPDHARFRRDQRASIGELGHGFARQPRKIAHPRGARSIPSPTGSCLAVWNDRRAQLGLALLRSRADQVCPSAT